MLLARKLGPWNPMPLFLYFGEPNSRLQRLDAKEDIDRQKIYHPDVNYTYRVSFVIVGGNRV
jgi:hypothetical protein